MLHTEYTVLIYLGDDGLEGGETVFWLPDPGFQTGKRKAGTVAGKTGSKARGYSRAAHGTGGDEENDVCTDGMCELAVPATKGTLLIHRHGDACLLHEGRKVIRGSKYVLRTDLVFELRGR